ncbi:MAG: acyltransferase [Pseudomonadota bacterium]
MRINNFDGLRLAGALGVLWSHMFLVSGRSEPLTPIGGTYGHVSVLMFFAISGHLVALSWRRDPHMLRFLARRALRILPGVAVALMAAHAAVRLLGLTGFPENPYHQLNESLWTIPLEVYCYFILAAILFWVRRAGLAMALLMFAGVVLARFLDSYLALFSYGLFFAIGVAVAEYRLLERPAVMLGMAAVALAFGLAGHAYMVRAMLLPLAVIYIGTRSWPVLRSAGKFGDLSYGIYIYAWPAQQITVAYLPDAPFALLLAISLAVTTCLASLSWHFIEKPALKFKPGGAGWMAGKHPMPAEAAPVDPAR